MDNDTQVYSELDTNKPQVPLKSPEQSGILEGIKLTYLHQRNDKSKPEYQNMFSCIL